MFAGWSECCHSLCVFPEPWLLSAQKQFVQEWGILMLSLFRLPDVNWGKFQTETLGQRTWQFIGGHCCWCPNDAKWCSVVCVERGSVLRKALVTKAAYWWSVIRPGCQVAREGLGHILMDNWRPVLWNPPLLWFSQFGPVSKVVRTCCCHGM